MAPAKRRNANECEDLNRFVTFRGTISRGDLTVPIRFRLRFGVDGELRFRVYSLRATREALDIRNERKATNAQFCTIKAVSISGTRFRVQECGPQFGQAFFRGVAFVAPAHAAEVPVQPEGRVSWWAKSARAPSKQTIWMSAKSQSRPKAAGRGWPRLSGGALFYFHFSFGWAWKPHQQGY